MECHKCPHAAELDKWAGVPWEKTPCAACCGPDERPNLRHVEFDEKRAVDLGSVRATGPGDLHLPVTELAKVLRRVWMLPEDLLQVYRLKMLGLTEAEVGDRLGIGKAGVSKRLARIRRVDPLLVAAVPRWGRGKPGSVPDGPAQPASGVEAGAPPAPDGQPSGTPGRKRGCAVRSGSGGVTVWEVEEDESGGG